jgi:hypothetical protein
MHCYRQKLECNEFSALPLLEYVGGRPAEFYYQDTQDKVLREFSLPSRTQGTQP